MNAILFRQRQSLLCVQYNMSASNYLNPQPVLKESEGQMVLVKLKWGSSYKGTFVSADRYFNFRLKDASEVIKGEERPVGEILIRCNNVLYFRTLFTPASLQV
ncbi:hypothetical protein KIPB_004160 [Kipferlia bialata]|uniref:Sm protein F n=1 Tax=Kipferlia bialata TaxID=797122 RepID=A0A391NKI7_9EUKA|nr:hypothetical protein KIPB_004160 [Kipferlia bialata]|eukprot:g4160.t1